MNFNRNSKSDFKDNIHDIKQNIKNDFKREFENKKNILHDLHLLRQIPTSEIILAFQERARIVEKRINIGRVFLLFVFGAMDLFFSYKSNNLENFPLWIALASAMTMSIIFIFVHWMTRKENFKFWLPFVTTSFDYLMMLVIAIEYMQLKFLPFNPELVVHFFNIIFILLIFLNALRYGKWIITYNTLLALSASLYLMIKINFNYIPLFYAAVMISIAGVLTLIISANIENLFTKVQNRETLKRFLPREIVDRIDSGNINLKLGGINKDVTLLLSDIRGFTSISEKYHPEEVVTLLNHYFTEMCDIVFEFGGSIDKFIGDAILAVFGLTDSQKNPEELAIATALKMHQKLSGINRELANYNFDPLAIGVAIHSGQVLAGNIGSLERMDYTIIGDTVNTVARIEPLNKTYQTKILLSDSVVQKLNGNTPSQVKDRSLKIKFIDEATLRGKTNRIKLYTLE